MISVGNSGLSAFMASAEPWRLDSYLEIVGHNESKKMSLAKAPRRKGKNNFRIL
jgi:hypothetical protein